MASPKPPRDAPKNEDLSLILAGMEASIEGAMTSLYNLEIATINENGRNPPHHSQRYREIREKLKGQWEAIASLLKKCHSFGDDVVLLKAHMTSASKKDLEGFLEDMAATCKECTTIADVLVKRHDSVMAVYFTHEETFKGHLDRPRSGMDPRALRNDRYKDGPPPFQDDIYPHDTRAPRPGARNQTDSNMTDFVERFKASTQGVYSQLEALQAFLQVQYQICEQYIVGLEKPAQALTPEKVQDLATKWTKYQVDIMNSILAITKQDAIAKPAPYHALDYLAYFSFNLWLE